MTLFFRCFIVYGKASKKYKLICIKFSDPFLFIISNSADSPYIKSVTHKIRVSYHQHVPNRKQIIEIVHIECVDVFRIHMNTKFHMPHTSL
jgi:hypothetical protein